MGEVIGHEGYDSSVVDTDSEPEALSLTLSALIDIKQIIGPPGIGFHSLKQGYIRNVLLISPPD